MHVQLIDDDDDNWFSVIDCTCVIYLVGIGMAMN